MEDFPTNAHLQYDFFLSLTNYEFWPGEQTSWCCWNYSVYLKLRPDANIAQLEKKMLSIRDTYYIGYLKERGDPSIEDVRKYYSLRLQPVADIYLNTEDISDNLHHGDARYIWLFGGIAIFILVLACINFINLSTAKSVNRAKEVGLRKVVGSARKSLVTQFLMESTLYSFISFLLGILIVFLVLPFFNQLAGKSLTIPWATWWIFPTLLLAALVIGFLAGIYPSFYLSAFKPMDVLKGKVSRGVKSSKLRSGMVVFQFITSIMLIIGTFIIYRQMNYMLHTKIGYEKDQVMMIYGANTLEHNQSTFKNELLRLADVEHTTITGYLPVDGMNREGYNFWKEGKIKEEKSLSAQRWRVDEDYIPTMGMKLVEGRNFNPEIASDSQAVIINRAMTRAMGFEDPIGQRITNAGQTWEVIGVVDDFNYESMKWTIDPLCLTLEHSGSIVSVKVKSKNMTSVLQSIQKVWDQLMPNQPFRYGFLDESYARMYSDVQRMGQLFATFSALAIFIACLGLFALSAFMVEQRKKEVSIRLVMGASVSSIFRLLTQNFVKLVLISFAIAAPLSWYLMQKWLEDFAYKIPITADVFMLTGFIAVMIALLTISYQSIRAALANPATSLRSE